MPTLRAAGDFEADLRRLMRHDRTLAVELRGLLTECLAVDGRVPDGYGPHSLDNPGGLYNGCMEFHLADDVLVLYSPLNPRRSVTLQRICTHEELRTGRFHREWPTGE
ncbi:MAG: type II toxin-antitoxin system YafQ family toxin [Bifidobacterium sp.]|nr:type II toxin-antitoxin system YafQ family toxin [Bifidobacterium sp.]